MVALSKVIEKMEHNIKFQYLEDSMVKAVDKRRMKDTEVTFATMENNTAGLTNGTGKTALIVWVDRDEFNQAVKDLEDS